MEAFRPRNQRIVIRPDPYPKSVGLLALPEIAQGDVHQRTRTGTVVSMGPGVLIEKGPRMGELWPMPDGKWPELLPDLHGKKVVYLAGTGQHTDIELPYTDPDGVTKMVEHHVVYDDVVDAYFDDEGTLVPIYDRVLVKRLDKIEKIGLIWVPDTAQQERYEGIVLAHGPGRFEKGRKQPLDVQVGDRVVFGKYQGIALKVKGEPRLMLREMDIFGVVESEEETLARGLTNIADSQPVPGGP